MILRRALVACLLLPALALAFNDGLGAPAADLNRTTPIATVSGFLDAAHARDWQRAAHYLYLDHLPPNEQPAEGKRLARRFVFLLDRHLWFDYERISNSPEGEPANSEFQTLGEIPSGLGSQTIRLRRVDAAEGPIWIFGERTVRAIDPLFAQHGSPLVERLPPWLFSRGLWILELWQWVGLGLLLLFGLFGGWLIEAMVLRLGARATGLTHTGWDDQVIAAGKGPLRVAILALVTGTGTRALLFPPPAQRVFDLLATWAAIVAIAWFALRFLKLAASFVEQRLAQQTGADAVKLRGAKTQLAVMRHVIEATVYVVAVSLILLQLEAVRSIGVSLLASAGVAGLVIGLAAQKSISTLLAGIQLSITQPVRIGDTVIVENEWGWVEEITLTYIVVKVWDLRRLIVPMTYFLERPFQNWSKVTPDILGTVELHTDYRADVEAIRGELGRVLREEGGTLWDGKVQGVQVTGTNERTMVVRILVSSADAGLSWDLRCLLRERLIAFLKLQPFGLPVLRAETHPLSPTSTEG